MKHLDNRFLKFLGILFWWITYFNPIWAFEAGSIRGKATDRSTGKSIVGAKVIVKIKEKIQFETLTQDDGTFILEAIPNGTYDVECKINPYFTQKFIGVQIKSGIRPLYFRMNYNANPDDKDSQKKIDLIYTYASLQEKEKQVISVASGEGDAKLDIPATGYLITSSDIETRGYYSLLDVLRDIPELQIQENVDPTIQNRLVTRGVQGSGAFMIMQNGVRFNSMTASDFVIAENLPVRHAGSIEIIIGPASALYGADAFAGVINIITKRGNDINGVNLFTSYGMFNTTKNTVYGGFGTAKKGLSFMGSYHRTDNPFFPKYYPAEWDWYTSYFAPNGQMMGFGGIQPAHEGLSRAYDLHQEDVTVNVQAHYKNIQTEINFQSNDHSSALGHSPTINAPLAGLRIKTNILSVASHYNLKISDKWAINYGGQGSIWWYSPKSNFNNVFTGYQPQGYKFGYELNGVMRVVANHQLNEKHKISFGLTLQNVKSLAKTADLTHPWDISKPEEEQNQYYPGSDFVTWDGDSLKVPTVFFKERRFVGGQFAQYQGDISPKLTLLAGFRFDIFWIRRITQQLTAFDNNTNVDFRPSPRAGIIYKPTDNFRLKLFAGYGFLTQPAQSSLEHYGSFFPRTDSLDRIVGLQSGFFHMPLIDEARRNLLSSVSKNIETSVIYTKSDFVLSGNGFVNFVKGISDYRTDIGQTFTTGIRRVDNLQIPVGAVEQLIIAYNAILFGATARADYRILAGRTSNLEFKFTAAYSYLSGAYQISHLIEQIRDTNQVPIVFPKEPYKVRTPNYSAAHTVKAAFEMRIQRFSLYTNFIFASPTQYTNFETQFKTETPMYWFVNAFAKYDLQENKGSGINGSLFVRVQNLTNNRYFNMGTQGFGYMDKVPQQPLSILAGITVNFNN